MLTRHDIINYFKVDEQEYKLFLEDANKKIKMWNRVTGIGERKVKLHPDGVKKC